jgi:antitoxin HigA-1
MTKKLKPVHPGKILEEEFLTPLKLSQYRVAKDISVPPRRINEIIKSQRAITVDTALRLGKYFGVTPQFWLNLQTSYDVAIVSSKIEHVLKHDVKQMQLA